MNFVHFQFAEKHYNGFQYTYITVKMTLDCYSNVNGNMYSVSNTWKHIRIWMTYSCFSVFSHPIPILLSWHVTRKKLQNSNLWSTFVNIPSSFFSFFFFFPFKIIVLIWSLVVLICRILSWIVNIRKSNCSRIIGCIHNSFLVSWKKCHKLLIFQSKFLYLNLWEVDWRCIGPRELS